MIVAGDHANNDLAAMKRIRGNPCLKQPDFQCVVC